LARGLVRDHGVAEDVVQETWLAALSRAPGEPGRLKPWLAHVLANFARKERRSGARRMEREALAARSEGLPSASEIATRLEAQRLLVEALDALEEPYKTTVVLRYFDGLEASEIARREGVPAGTVRWRLHEGLERLRARLDARSGGERASWALLCLPFVPAPSLTKLAGLAGVASIGVVIMSTSLRVAIVGLALLASALGVWIWVQEPAGAGPRASEARAAEQQQQEEEARARSLLERGEPSSEREVPAAARESSSASPAVAAPTLGPTVVEGRCIDADRRPLARVRLATSRSPRAAS
jgi:RNA polymerase sigma-70 factor (ECF subfamily)